MYNRKENRALFPEEIAILAIAVNVLNGYHPRTIGF